MGGWWRWALASPDGVAPSRMVGVSASVNLPLHHKVQKLSSGTGSPGWSRKRAVKRVCVCVCGPHLFGELQQSCAHLIMGTEGVPHPLELSGKCRGFLESGHPGISAQWYVHKTVVV